jgi:integral membrane protein (TIGR01906 family)
VATRLGGWLIAAAAALVILGASIAPFLTPPVVHFEQSRTGVHSQVIATIPEIERITDSLLADLVFWTGDFSVEAGPARCCPTQVLSTEERAHMQEVRNVFTGFWVLVLGSAVIVFVAFRRAKGTEARAAAWRAVRKGARSLVVVIAVLGAGAVVAFEAAFELFHRLFFSAGSYTFDPATSSLVRLFPYQFWSEISIAVGVVAIVASLSTAWFAGRRAARVAPAREAPALNATRVGA